MKYWHLMSIMRGEQGIVESEFLKPKWTEYLVYFRNDHAIVINQERNILDKELPDELVKNVLGKSSKRLFISEKTKIRTYRVYDSDEEISLLKASELLSGADLEEAFEKTEVKIKA